MLKHIPLHPRKIDAPALQAHLQIDGHAITLRSIQRDLNKLARAFPLIAANSKPLGWSWHPQSPQKGLPALDRQAALTFNLASVYLQKLLPSSTLDYLHPWFTTAKGVLDAQAKGISKWPDKIRTLSRGPISRPSAVDGRVHGIIYEALLQEKQVEVGYGADVRVLRPKRLREEFKQEAKALKGAYRA